ncbi:Sec-independent protein translocase subunit TatB [Catenulispora sp. NF23]|uniref:Sec-independent protein translocase subunit TatB n=1 Tax=Catenulispora pinistramenti TaxID=2705254 RepID=A0ABS5KIG7_9ACTN|nr:MULTISPECIES: sec-independent translocase [Catenulispora]MBS2533168.1 Sec-independent protein translocase subunit TatB [Catenulispora pinistramenti]MBS2545790.1 Sec-independent protein translocase subunit TatB [Catenulispora pinistramenti]
MPFLDISPLELIALLALAVMLFGPDKLPSAVQGLARTLRQFREFTRNAQNDLKKELGPEFQDLELTDLHPKNFVRKHVLGPEDGDFREIRDITDSLNGEIRSAAEGARRPLAADDATPDDALYRAPAPRLAAGERPPFDADAT